MTKQIEEMTDKMPDVIYAGYYKTSDNEDWCWSPEIVYVMKQGDCFVGGTYIRQDSINAPENLADAIVETDKQLKDCDGDEVPPEFTAILNAARELQRLKGLK